MNNRKGIEINQEAVHRKETTSDEVSEWEHVMSGAPQWSVLSIIFLIYVND